MSFAEYEAGGGATGVVVRAPNAALGWVGKRIDEGRVRPHGEGRRVSVVDAAERRDSRRGIREEILGLFRAAYPWETWGRLLVHVAVGADGRALVVDVAVEDIVGDEARLERAFQGPEVRASLDAGARCRGAGRARGPGAGDVVRRHVRSREGGLAFLPGLVRSPSIAFDRARDGNVARVVARNDALREAFGVGTDARVVPPPPGIVGRASVKRGGVLVATADAVALATSRGAGAPSRGRQNPSLDEPARKACVALLDTMPERSAWEVSTFGFATDEPTSWALAAWVVDVHAFAGLVAIDADDGVIFVALRDVRAEAST